MGRNNAAACYRELGAEMKKLREMAGLTGAQVARRTNWSTTKLSRMETGHLNISVTDLVWFLGICGVPYEVAVPLIDLCRHSKADNGYWLSAHGEWIPDTLSSLIYHEANASVSTSYEPMVVPGLLQTEDYARAMISRESWRTIADVDAAVQTRLDRQRALSRRQACFVFYIHEQALRLEVGGPAVMHEQLLALTLASSAATVMVRVVPAASGELSYFGQDFRMFQFEEHNPLIYLSGPVAALFIEDQQYVSTYELMTADLASVAMGAEESRELMSAMADDYDRGSMDAAGRVEEEQL